MAIDSAEPVEVTWWFPSSRGRCLELMYLDWTNDPANGSHGEDSRGRPRMRSEMMLRWISSVPP